MANYQATTVSDGGKIKQGSEKEIQTIIDEFDFGELTVEIMGGELQIYGYDGTYAYYKDDEDMDEDVFDDFLTKITPFLEEKLVVSEVGAEKCRYALAYAYIAQPNKKVISVSLEEAINEALKKD